MSFFFVVSLLFRLEKKIAMNSYLGFGPFYGILLIVTVQHY